MAHKCNTTIERHWPERGLYHIVPDGQKKKAEIRQMSYVSGK